MALDRIRRGNNPAPELSRIGARLGLMGMIGLAAVLELPAMALSAETAAPQPAAKSAKPQKCLEAMVNPVTGSAICTNPRGAPVAPPPVSDLHPCKPRAHDNETGTIYEHWSGC